MSVIRILFGHMQKAPVWDEGEGTLVPEQELT